MSSNWGGNRVGAGQKPQGPLAAIDGRGHELAQPPEDLPEDQRAFWQENAPKAIEKGTLTQHTVTAFRLLCEVNEERRQTRDTIRAQGRTFIKVTVDGAGVEHQELKAHPLTGAYGRLAKTEEASMKAFALAPFGKAEPGRAKAKAVNPFQSQVG